MQKYIKNDLSEIRYFEDEVLVSDWVDLSVYRLMSEAEILRHETNPHTAYHVWDVVSQSWVDGRTPDEILDTKRSQMPHLTKREFRAKLRDAQLFDSVEAYVKAGDGYLQDAWEYADYFARLDPFILKAIEVLDLDPVMVDTLWSS